MNAREQARFDMIKRAESQQRLSLPRASRFLVRAIGKYVCCLLFAVFATPAESTPEADAKTYYVVGVARGDTLKVRSSPSQSSRVVATLRNGDGGITITGKIIMNGNDDWVPIVVSDVEGWVRPKFLSPTRDQGEKPQPAHTREGLIGELLIDCQNQLIPVVQFLENGRALRALEELCPDSTPAQRSNVRSALHLMVNDDFLESVKKEGGILTLAPRIKAAAVIKDPSLSGNSCLLKVIDETVEQLLTHPFGF
jgi:Bacterial SH3 domain